MARDKQKKRKRAASAPRDNTKWARRLTEALGNLQWEEATPEDLATGTAAAARLSAGRAGEELHETAPGDEEDEVEVAEAASNVPLLDELERLVAHDGQLVRCAAWGRRSATRRSRRHRSRRRRWPRGLHRTALSQLCASTAAAAAGPDGATADLWVRLLGVVWNFGERHEEVVAVGAADITAVAKCLTVNAAAVLGARAAATVETAAAAAAEAAGEEGGGSDLADVVHLTEQGVAATAWQLLLVLTDCRATHARALVANADWRAAIVALFRLSSAAADANRRRQWRRRSAVACSVLCAAVALAVGAQTSLGAGRIDELGQSIESTASSGAARSLPPRWGGDATDAAKKLALEAIANAYAADDGRRARRVAARARRRKLLPPRFLLVRPTAARSSPHSRPAVAAAADAAAPDRRPPPRPPTPPADAAERGGRGGGAWRFGRPPVRGRRTGGGFGRRGDVTSTAEVRAAATAMLRALLPFARTLGAFVYHDTREELLRLMSAAISATADDEGAPPPALTLSLPADLQTQLCAAAGGLAARRGRRRARRGGGARRRRAARVRGADGAAKVEAELVHGLAPAAEGSARRRRGRRRAPRRRPRRRRRRRRPARAALADRDGRLARRRREGPRAPELLDGGLPNGVEFFDYKNMRMDWTEPRQTAVEVTVGAPTPPSAPPSSPSGGRRWPAIAEEDQDG